MAEDGIPPNPIISINSPEASGSIPASIDSSVNLNAITNNNDSNILTPNGETTNNNPIIAISSPLASGSIPASTNTTTNNVTTNGGTINNNNIEGLKVNQSDSLKPSPKPDRAAEGSANNNGNGNGKRRPSVTATTGGGGKEIKKPKDRKKFLRKKELTGVAVRGEHLLRLVQTTRLNRQQILQIADKFYVFAPSGVMTQAEFNKALEFDKEDAFANRLFVLFESEKHSGRLYMDDFIIGLSKVAPDTDINTKLDLCYELFDVDSNGGVNISEFREMTKYSMRHGRFGIEEEKLNKIVDLQWKQLDFGGDNVVSREEFKTVLKSQKAFVNSLTLQVPWLQQAFRVKLLSAVAQYEYLGTEPLEMLIRDVAKQLNASDEDINKWSAILRRNLYHDVKSLREIDSTDWTSMDLPRRLFAAVHRAIEPDHQTNSQIMEGRVKHNVASSRNHRLRIFLESHKSSITFFTLYFLGNLAMLAWTLTKYLTPRVGEKYHDQYNIIGPSFVISRCAGALAKYNFALMLFPVCYRTMTWMRSSVLEHFLPIDVAMKFHRRVGALILLLGLIHMAAHCVNFLRLSRQTDIARVNAAFGFNFASAPSQASLHGTRTGITGWLMVAFMLTLVLFAIERVRRSNFRAFFTIHHLYIPIIVLLVIHDGLINPIEIIYWMIPSIALFLAERAVTVYRAIPQYQVLEGTRILKGDVLALHIQKPAWFKYSAGHYLWINCPTISAVEWHPFTLTSSPDEEFLMVDINCIGDWTKNLKELYSKHLAKAEKKGKKKDKDQNQIEIEMDSTTSSPLEIPNPEERKGMYAEEAEVMAPIKGKLLLQLRLDGPYGTASGDVLLFTHVLLVGGGIGVTPFISILKSIRHAVLFKNDCPLHAVHFIWVTKNQENFQWFSMMLADLQRHEDLRGFLKVSIYLTGPRHPINDIRLLGVSLLMNKAKEELNEDLVTGLEGDTYFGRPDFSKILLQHNKEWAGNDVGVFFCGPEPLAQAIRVTCRALNHANQLPIGRRQVKKGARFFFKQEHF